LRSARRLTWFILGISALFAAAGLIFFVRLYIANFIELPRLLEGFANSVSEAKNIQALKLACISLANITEAERSSRLLWMIGGLGMVVLLGVLCAVLSTRLLMALGRLQKEATRQATVPSLLPPVSGRKRTAQADDGIKKRGRAKPAAGNEAMQLADAPVPVSPASKTQKTAQTETGVKKRTRAKTVPDTVLPE